MTIMMAVEWHPETVGSLKVLKTMVNVQYKCSLRLRYWYLLLHAHEVVELYETGMKKPKGYMILRPSNEP
jgi:hypothetical protein